MTPRLVLLAAPTEAMLAAFASAAWPLEGNAYTYHPDRGLAAALAAALAVSRDTLADAIRLALLRVPKPEEGDTMEETVLSELDYDLAVADALLAALAAPEDQT